MRTRSVVNPGGAQVGVSWEQINADHEGSLRLSLSGWVCAVISHFVSIVNQTQPPEETIWRKWGSLFLFLIISWLCVCPLSNYFAVVIFLFISVCEQTAPAPKTAESIRRYSKKRERKKVEAVKSQERALAGRTWQASWSSILSPYVACQATKLRPVAHTPWRTEIYNTAVLNMAGKQIHMHGKAHGEEGFTTEMLLTWGLLRNTCKSGFKSWVPSYAEATRYKSHMLLSNMLYSAHVFFSVGWSHMVLHNCYFSWGLKQTWGGSASHDRIRFHTP